MPGSRTAAARARRAAGSAVPSSPGNGDGASVRSCCPWSGAWSASGMRATVRGPSTRSYACGRTSPGARRDPGSRGRPGAVPDDGRARRWHPGRMPTADDLLPLCIGLGLVGVVVAVIAFVRGRRGRALQALALALAVVALSPHRPAAPGLGAVVADARSATGDVFDLAASIGSPCSRWAWCCGTWAACCPSEPPGAQGGRPSRPWAPPARLSPGRAWRSPPHVPRRRRPRSPRRRKTTWPRSRPC